MSGPEFRFGPYRILEQIGEGGMCRVFRARRPDLPIDCALKVLRADARKDERARDLFLTEADLSLLLRHPNLIRSYDAGEVEGRAYIVMELLEGGTVAGLVEALRRGGTRLPDDLATLIVSEALAGLDALHEATGETGRPLGIVHRDVTPQNIFLGDDGRVVLGDYGVVHIEAHGSSDGYEVPGKLPYLCPEALAGEPVDRRADIFSAGVILYELLVGQLPFLGATDDDTMDLIVDARLTKPTRIRPDLPSELEAVILRALTRRPKDRFQTAADFRDALEPFVDPVLANARILGALMRGLEPR